MMLSINGVTQKMMTAESTAAPFRFHGTNARYVDIGARGTERLSLSVEYAPHYSNVGYFILRFVAHGDGVKTTNFKHLMYRQQAKFITMDPDKAIQEAFRGFRLNKIAVPAFKPAVKPWEVDEFALKLDIWLKLEEWVKAQMAAEGFTLIDGIDLYKEIRTGALHRLPAPPTPTENVTSVLEFPDLEAPAQQAASLKLVQKPEADEDEDTDLDGDEDEDEDDKDWLN